MVAAGNVYARFGAWAVTSHGLEHMGHPPYSIAKSRVHDAYADYGRDSWIDHMSSKRWVNVADFGAALHDAQARWPRKLRPAMYPRKRTVLSKREQAGLRLLLGRP